ncbi:MAG: nucleotidyltransferase family protein, partial [Eubacteriales bacterium]|nr:nucleotidyltransferase family protein [Eubacteriales bacterium]
RYIEAMMHKSKQRTLISPYAVGDESSACNAESLKFMQDSEAGGAEKLKSVQYSEAESVSAGSMYAANNILAVEYIKALNSFDTGHKIQPIAIQRVGDGFNAEEAKDEKYCSATAIRAELAKHSVYGSKLNTENASERDKDKSLYDTRKVKTEVYTERTASIEAGRSELNGFLDNYAPNIGELILKYAVKPVEPDILSDLLNKELLTAKYRGGELERCLDVSKEIADRLIKRADVPLGFTERIRDTKTRQYTYTRISRSLLHIVLGITDADMETAKADGYIKYLRILGFRRESSELMKELKNNARLPIVTKIADNKELMKDEIYYSGIYYALTGAKSEYERSPVIVD